MMAQSRRRFRADGEMLCRPIGMQIAVRLACRGARLVGISELVSCVHWYRSVQLAQARAARDIRSPPLILRVTLAPVAPTPIVRQQATVRTVLKSGSAMGPTSPFAAALFFPVSTLSTAATTRSVAEDRFAVATLPCPRAGSARAGSCASLPARATTIAQGATPARTLGTAAHARATNVPNIFHVRVAHA